jgi:REP element-mobilizing transposase RayT
MPREPRLVLVEYLHHIILRGNSRSAIFYDHEDRRFSINFLRDAKEKTKLENCNTKKGEFRGKRIY